MVPQFSFWMLSRKALNKSPLISIEQIGVGLKSCRIHFSFSKTLSPRNGPYRGNLLVVHSLEERLCFLLGKKKAI